MPAARRHRLGLFRLLQLLLLEYPGLRDQLSKALRATPQKGKGPTTVQFTPSERRIVERIVNDDEKFTAIWSELGMKKRTFDSHLDRIYTKLGTRKRSGLVREAIRRGLV